MKNIPKSERKHIVFLGKRNAGKSSLMNRFVGQELMIVSDTPGTTTDPVKKAMELLPFGPVVLVDTAGIDDVGELGSKRISKTMKSLSEADLAILVIDSMDDIDNNLSELISHLKLIEVPFITVFNKVELGINKKIITELERRNIFPLQVSCYKNEGIDKLKEIVIKRIPSEEEPPLIGDLIKQHDTILLVVPIDLGAPKGRLIMPQVQTIRESLDEDAIVIVTKDKELRAALDNLKTPPKLVVTDSQAVMRVTADVPDEIMLTTFSIVMARYKGDLKEFVKAVKVIDTLENGDKILIAESCSHHAQEDDIGKVKIPRWIRNHTRKELEIDVRNGIDYPDDLSEYKLIVHCGGCMLTRRAMQVRIKQAKMMNIPIVNYGVLISYMHGAIPRALMPFEDAMLEWEKLSEVKA